MDPNKPEAPPVDRSSKPRFLSFKEARLELLRDAQSLTVQQRLEESYRLTCQGYAWKGIDLAQSQTDFTLSRVTRPKC